MKDRRIKMCIDYSEAKSNRWLDEHEDNKEYTAYKCVHTTAIWNEEKVRYERYLCSPYFSSFTYVVGINEPNNVGTLTGVEILTFLDSIQSSAGIYVYLSKEDCLNYECASGERIVAVKVKKKDLCGVSKCGRKAVFRKVRIRKQDYESAMTHVVKNICSENNLCCNIIVDG